MLSSVIIAWPVLHLHCRGVRHGGFPSVLRPDRLHERRFAEQSRHSTAGLSQETRAARQRLQGAASLRRTPCSVGGLIVIILTPMLLFWLLCYNSVSYVAILAPMRCSWVLSYVWWLLVHPCLPKDQHCLNEMLFCYVTINLDHLMIGKMVQLKNSQRHLGQCLIICINGLVQDCGISIAKSLEIWQSCTKPSTW